eukprot:102126-Rhodomonas_salina.1
MGYAGTRCPVLTWAMLPKGHEAGERGGRDAREVLEEDRGGGRGSGSVYCRGRGGAGSVQGSGLSPYPPLRNQTHTTTNSVQTDQESAVFSLIWPCFSAQYHTSVGPFAMRRAVLSYCTVRFARCYAVWAYSTAIRLSYALSGTERGYAATRRR